MPGFSNESQHVGPGLENRRELVEFLPDMPVASRAQLFAVDTNFQWFVRRNEKSSTSDIFIFR